MQKYESLIFDLDDTLTDNGKSIKYAFKMLIKYLEIEYSDELLEKWKKFDITYWHEWESGNMVIPNSIQTLEEKITYLRSNRFIIFFKELNIDFDTAINLNKLYSDMLGVNVVEIEGAYKLLCELSSSYEIIIATNGPRNAAINKLEKAKLIKYVSLIVSSEEVGFSKPMLEFFKFLFEKAKNKDKNKMLLIGDSLTTDILGGMNSGIDTCFFNPNDTSVPIEYNPTMTINKLLQLKNKL